MLWSLNTLPAYVAKSLKGASFFECPITLPVEKRPSTAFCSLDLITAVGYLEYFVHIEKRDELYCLV